MVFSDSLKLNNGKHIPIVGLGTWQGSSEELERALDAALEMGYRHIDTAFNYQNEETIGKTLNKWLSSGKIKREELFIVTKLPMIGMNREGPKAFLDKSLKALQLDYVDLYLVHAPVGFNYQGDDKLFPVTKEGKLDVDMTTDLLAIWKGMEEQVDKGRTMSIGISNFSERQIQKIWDSARIKPANLQVEVHAYFQQKPLRKFCESKGITVVAYGPLGSPGRVQFYQKVGRPAPTDIPALLDNELVKAIAKRHRVTPGQVLLRHLAQENVIVIPKSTNPARLQLNYQIFNFCLTPDEIQALDDLDAGPAGRTFTFNSFPGVEDHPEYDMGK